MKALVLEKKDVMSIKDVPKPEMTEEQVLIKVKSVGICGSDIHYWKHGKIGSFVVEKPMILGHEVSGEVIDYGKNVNGFSKGDLVVIEPGKTCGKCEFCKSGRYNLCSDIEFYATPPYDGAICEYLAFDSSSVFKVPDGIDSEMATLVEPLAVGTFSTSKLQIKLSDKVIIFGAGVIGLCCMITAIESGASEVVVVDVRDDRLKTAYELGASKIYNITHQELPLKYFDKAYECTGVAESLFNASKSVKPGGDIALIGLGAESRQLAPIVEIIINEQRLIPTFRYANSYPASLKIIAKNKDKFSKLITHRYNFNDSEKAFITAKDDKTAIKVIINFV